MEGPPPVREGGDHHLDVPEPVESHIGPEDRAVPGVGLHSHHAPGLPDQPGPEEGEVAEVGASVHEGHSRAQEAPQQPRRLLPV